MSTLLDDNLTRESKNRS